MNYERAADSFRDEALSHTKFKIYSARAREEGYPTLSRLFDEIASEELAHAEIFMRASGSLGDTEKNLTDAAFQKNEAAEAYGDWADEEEDDVKLRALESVERRHEEQLLNCLTKMVNDAEYIREDNTKWRCTNCGFTALGKNSPTACPLCSYPQDWFREAD